jgi:hypothetical protein
MKNKNKIIMKYLFLLFLAITINSCDKNDDDSPRDPISRLPPATQTGANTFGALLDGEPFIPAGGSNPLDAQYQLINGEWYFFVGGSKRVEDFNLLSLSLSTNARELETGQTYILVSEFDAGGVSGVYGFNGDFYDTDDLNSGELSITRLDLNAQIVSGTFFFDIIDENGELREIREGRFDMRFTR